MRRHRGTAFSVSQFTPVAVPDCRFRIADSGLITTRFFILVPFLKRTPYIIIHLARNAKRRGGGVVMSIILPNVFVRFRIPFPDSGFRILPFPYALYIKYAPNFVYFSSVSRVCVERILSSPHILNLRSLLPFHDQYIFFLFRKRNLCKRSKLDIEKFAIWKDCRVC